MCMLPFAILQTETEKNHGDDLPVITTTSLVAGDFPRLWKHGKITPGFKSWDADEVNVYSHTSFTV